jgi:lycopene cyclase domain-containing protein
VKGAYLAGLCVSLAGVAVLDARYRLAVWRPGARRRALAALAVGLGAFLAWDAVGIVLGIFRSGHGSWLTGVVLAPHLPLEEPFFLLFLCYLTLVLVLGAQRVLEARTRRGAS